MNKAVWFMCVTNPRCGAMLTSSAIKECVRSGKIKIDPFNENQLNPNSYNVRINGIIRELVPLSGHIDSRNPNFQNDCIFSIPESGLVIYPGNIYLIQTVEEIGSEIYVPILTGRSSSGRLGISVHQAADFGDLGYFGKFTLQVSVVYPTRIYPNQQLAQIYFLRSESHDIAQDILYHGHYANHGSPVIHPDALK